jgi:hypothetical protein
MMSESLNLLEISVLVQNCTRIVQLIKRTNNAPKTNFLIIPSNKNPEKRQFWNLQIKFPLVA